MAKFYGVNPAATKEVDLNNFVGQLGDQGKENKTHTLNYASKVRPATASEHLVESGHSHPKVPCD